ncbi:MAG: NADPH-dependent glutamate synthase [Succinivibrionaceae bacterium]
MINFSRKKYPMPEQDPAVRCTNFLESQTGYTEDMAISEAMRCLKCREHPCMTSGCPVHNHIPEFIDKICHGEFEEAYQILRQTTCLPAVCGRVCPQEEQCEGHCVRGLKGQPVSIGALERFVADWHRTHTPEDQSEKVPSLKKKVAVIGSGPASIAAAKELSDYGYDVTIFEKEEKLGGILTYGIPEFRLPKNIVQHEIELLKKKDVKFQCGQSLSQENSLQDFKEKQGFDAIFLGFGAGVPTTMDIPGTDLKGVYQANDFLIKVNTLQDSNPLGKKYDTIAVIGGGNVAMDACRSAVRTSARKVLVLYRRSEAEMPAHVGEIKEARDEGVEFIFLTSPVAIKGDKDGNVNAIECINNKLGEDDSRGRRKPVAIPDSNHEIPVDCVIMAVGTAADVDLIEDLGLDHDAKGRLKVDKETLETNIRGVFAGGDNVTGPKTVISAMGAGRQAAAAIHSFLSR